MTNQNTAARARGEGSIYRRRDGRYAGYVWITTLSGATREPERPPAHRDTLDANQRPAGRTNSSTIMNAGPAKDPG